MLWTNNKFWIRFIRSNINARSRSVTRIRISNKYIQQQNKIGWEVGAARGNQNTTPPRKIAWSGIPLTQTVWVKIPWLPNTFQVNTSAVERCCVCIVSISCRTYNIYGYASRWWQYPFEYTRSPLTSEVKQRRARLVVERVSGWEDLRVLSVFVNPNETK